VDTDTPPAVATAVIVATPAPTPFTSPVDVTVATFTAEELQATFAVIVTPFWSRGVAIHCSECPTVVLDPDVVVITTDVSVCVVLFDVGESPPPHEARNDAQIANEMERRRINVRWKL
jgi:hypothetical protein